MNILVFTSLWPNGEQPNFGVFVKNRIAAMAGIKGVNVRVVAPVPYFPSKFQSRFIPVHWRRIARIPEIETVAGIETHHPRHLVTPKVGMTLYGRWMAKGAERIVRRLHAETPIDLIDAHYVYPDGYAAVLLGKALNLPVIVSARGTDVNLFSRMPLIRPLVRRVLNRADGLIAVSAALKNRMVELGVSERKIAVIPNGVDRSIFFPRDRDQMRRRLGLGLADKIVMTVSALVPLKGIDRLIDAIALAGDPGIKFYVIGEGPLRAELESRISKLGLSEKVFLVGSKTQAELAEWYSAADLFCLASSREGCPNVVIEALACGLPVIAADVGGVKELITDEKYGRALAVPTADNFAAEIRRANELNWNREAIAESGALRSWEDVAKEVVEYYRLRGYRTGIVSDQYRSCR